MKMYKYPSTSQFREVVHNIKHQATYVGLDEAGEPIYDGSLELPKIKFYGTVKLHGTNAGVCYDHETDTIWAQSRENIITPEKDNAGFATFVYCKQEVLKKMIKKYFYALEKDYGQKYDLNKFIVTVYGEWAGKGIQKGVGISEIPKSFFVFGIKISPKEEELEGLVVEWLDSGLTANIGHGDVLLLNEGSENIWNIELFKTFEIEIDFNDPQRVVNDMIAMVEEVEAECPVAKDFDISGIGEGIVFTGHYKGSRHRFKVKGEKHQSSKVKTLTAVDVEKLNSVKEFVDYAVTDNRLAQGIEQVFTSNGELADIKKTGDFVKWVSSDVFKEEMDTLIASGLEPKDVGSAISSKAVKWYKQFLMDNL